MPAKKEWTEEEKLGYLRTGRADDPLSEVRFYRNIGFPIAKLMAKTPLTANHVTLIGMFFNLGVGAALLGGNYYYLLLAAFLLQMGILFDFIDGSLARLKKTSSSFGAWFDSVAHQFVFLGLFLGIPLGLTLHAPQYWLNFFAQFGIDFRIVVWILSLLGLFNFLSMMEFKVVYVKISRSKVGEKFKLKQGDKWGWKKYLFLNKPFLTNFFTVGFVLNQLFIFLVIFAVYSSLYLVALVFYYKKNLHRLDQKE